jgi:aminomethyltransferase
VDHVDSLAGGEVLRLNGEDVGEVNSPCWSHRMNKSLALVHLRPDLARPNTRLDVVGDDFSGTATVETIPFYDPGKSRTHA